jgi:phenylalanyl-tRNA synthetase beta chain
MQDRLNAIGVRPVNNVVDITNYVLMEIGHPLHAFNYDSLENHSVIVKPAKQGEEFITLDHKKRTLSNDTLMICDGKGPVAIAGIMGGADTEISATTSNILLESAYFNPRSIRRSSKNFGLSTDASQRFERGADPAITRWAADRAISLIQEICGGEVLKGAIDVYPGKRTPRKVSLRTKKMNEVLGTSLTPEEIIPLLKSIDIQPSRPNTRKKSDKIDFVIPTFRPDLEREIDLIEEVARRNGYDNIETKTRTALEVSADAPKVEFTDELRNCLVGIGYREAVGNSMQEESIASIATSKFVKIANPISKDMAALRTSLLPGMLQIIRNNIFHSNKNIRLFEIGNVYFDDPSSGKYKYVGNYIEEERVLISISGANIPQNWSKKQRPVDIYDLKGEIESLFQKIFLDKFKFIPYPNTKALTQSGLVIEINREEAGFIGNVSTELLRKYEIDQDVIVCELSIDLLNSNVRRELKYKAAPRYPSVLRDIAFVVDDPLPIEVLGNEIRSVSGSLLTQLDLFDIYTGDQIKGNKKSCAFALEFQAEDHTLSQEEIDQVMQKIIHHISAKFTATIRM